MKRPHSPRASACAAALASAVLVLLLGCQAEGPATPSDTPAAATAEAGPSAADLASPTVGRPAGTAPPPTVGESSVPHQTEPTATAEPRPTNGNATAEWLYLADFPAESAIEVASVAAMADGFIAVGFEPAPGEGFGGRRNGVVWLSPDGRSWSRSQPPVFENVALLHVLGRGADTLAFGDYSICPEFSEDCQDAADAGIGLWRSTDAVNWQRLTVPISMQQALLDGVANAGERVVAYGSTGDELSGAIWLSGDGETWDEIRDLAAVDPISALGGSSERLVAFGTRYLAEADEVETLAGYSDGGGFAPAQLSAGQRGVIQAVAASESGFVAVGLEHSLTEEQLLAVALVSPDGASWRAAAPDDVPTGAALHDVLAVPGGYLAIGSVAAADEFDRERGLSWFSADGLRWVEHAALDGPAFRQLNGSAVGPSGALVFATDFEEGDEEDPAAPGASTIHAWFLPAEALP